MISFILNTASLNPETWSRRNFFRGRSYGFRSKLVPKEILPRLAGFDEILVVGAYKPWMEDSGLPKYQYIPMKPIFGDRRDGLHQRDLGGRYSHGDILVFCHDDHAPDDNFLNRLRENYVDDPSWDILVPRRVHAITRETLENGKTENYMGGHLCVFRRWIWAEAPFTTVDTEYWDVTMTRIWRERGAKIVHVDDLVHLDLEALEEET